MTSLDIWEAQDARKEILRDIGTGGRVHAPKYCSHRLLGVSWWCLHLTLIKDLTDF